MRASVLRVTVLWLLPAAALSAPPEPDWMFQAAVSALAAASAVTEFAPHQNLWARLLASMSTCRALMRPPSATRASTVLFTLWRALDPLAPTAEADTLSTLPLNWLVWSAVSVKVAALRLWVASPAPVRAVVLLWLEVPTLAAEPETMPPLPETAVAWLSSLPVAVTATVPVRPLALAMCTPSPRRAWVWVSELAWAMVAPAASAPSDTPVTSVRWRVVLAASTRTLVSTVSVLLSPSLASTLPVLLLSA